MWKSIDGKLVRSYKFSNFSEAINFINKVAEICKQENHHPEIFNDYSKVILSFYTHDQENKITSKDYHLTHLIDALS